MRFSVTASFLRLLPLFWVTVLPKARTSPNGTVFDPAGAAVQGCALQLVSTDRVVLQQAVTDSHGVFRLKDPAPGDYTIVIPTCHGFAAEIVPIHIGGERMQSLDVHLRLPEVNEKVDVADDSSDVTTDPGANSDQATASSQLIEKIPVLNQDVISTFTPFLSQTGVNSRGVTLVVDGIETKSSGILNARPAGIGRNTLTTAGYAILDLRWSHDFALPMTRDKAPTATFAVDAFNSLNRTNYSVYAGNVQSQFFEQPTSALPARRIRFTARFKF
jgi:hypothetical protein